MIKPRLINMIILLLLICAACFDDGTAQLNNRERIISFDSEIIVNEDASMIVTEIIKVHSEGNKIKRGIYRDFPTEYEDDYGNNISIKFKVLEVLRDGVSEGYHTEGLSNGTRVYVGKSNVFLRQGDYTYTIKYITNRQIGYFDNFDELYWNVTGNGWDFIIERASAKVKLPGGIFNSDINTFGYTGGYGSRDKNFRVLKSGRGVIEFTTTQEIYPREGLTIVVQWPKGFVHEPTTSEKFSYFIEDNTSIIVGLIGAILILFYYLFVWHRVGVDPKKGVIIPLYEPPKDLSPAAVRFIYEMGFDDKVFSAAVIDLAVKGYITIDEDDKGDYTLISNGSTKNISPEEKKILSKLKFITASGDSKTKQQIELKQKNHKKIKNTINAAKASLKNSFEKMYFITNKKYFIVGLILSVLVLIITALFGSFEQIFGLIWISIWSIGVAVLMFTVFKAWRGVIHKRKARAAGIGGAIFITMFSIPFVIGEFVGFFLLSETGSLLVILVIGLLALINIFFYHLLKAPTLLGRKIMDGIEGFKMYLSTAEQDRLESYSPVKTPELFEKFLPYALALNVENEWSEKFSDVLSAAGESGNEYSPGWYTGTMWSTVGAAGFTSSLSSGFSSAISSSSTAPGSSSGGGGGGFSGGGGGGGGGGGW